MDEHKVVRSTTRTADRRATVGVTTASGALGNGGRREETTSQNSRISALLDEMRPGRHSTAHLPPPRKAHTTNLVDLAQLLTARNAIYGSWQDRQPRSYGGSQQLSTASTASLALPKYDQLYCDTDGKSESRHTLATTGLRRDPPEYGVLSNRPISSWKLTASDQRPTQAGWLKNSRPLARGALSPAAYFMELENRNGANSPIASGLSVVAVPTTSTAMTRVQMRAASTNGTTRNTQSLTSESSVTAQDPEEKSENCPGSPAEVLRRNSARQASFMAAMQIHPLRDSSQIYQDTAEKTTENKEQIKETPVRRARDREDSIRRRQSSRSMGPDFSTLRASTNSVAPDNNSTNNRTSTTSTVLPDRESSSQEEDSDAMKMIRRARPKSYVLATSSSIQDEVSSSIINEQSSSTTSSYDLPSSVSGSNHHQSRAPTSSTSTNNSSSTSGGNTSRSLNAPHPPAAHRLQRFIALFNSNKTPADDHLDSKRSRTKREMKRSRTSLPTSRFSLPGTILQRDTVDRQTWVKHQEIALGKSGKRNHWEDRWAVLCRRNLYLCVESPIQNGEKVVELAAHISIDVRNSIVDIAYDWLSASFSKQRHVVRIVTQTRSEHLIELNTESEMLSWISVLQSSSEDDDVMEEESVEKVGAPEGSVMATLSSKLHNSQSIASLASSSCSTTTSELVSSSHYHSHHHHLHNNQTSGSSSSAATTTTNHNNNELSTAGGPSVPQLTSSASFGGLSTATSVSATENAKNRLIMHRYIAKNSQLQSPTSNKRIEVDVAASMGPPTPSTNDASPCTTCPTQLAGPSRTEGENGEATTPKSGRKWKKSKAVKQGSGGGSSGSLLGSQGSSGAGAVPQQVLGVRLADCHVGNCEDHVPMLVQICVSVVETHGMDTVGIYRIPGNTAAVNALKESLSSRGFDNIDPANVEALDPRWRDVNVVSSLLKMFLRKLPEPLLTDKLYPFFIDANRISTHHNRLHKLRNLLRKLPRPHYDTLRFLILHLAEITRHSDVNKMECRNLALMFGPSIVRPSDDNMATMVTHMSDQCKIIETLIHYNTWMFDESSTVEDAVPEQHPADGQNQLEPGGYGVGVPTGVSAASFNDMHNLIRKANEDQAAAMMNEGSSGGKGQKIKNMLRRNSRRDKSKGKLKIESTAPAAVNPRGSGAWQKPTPSNTSGASVESAFCGNYQERDIDAEIESRQTISPQMTSGSADGVEVSSTRLDQSPSLESSLGSLPDTSRTEPILSYSGSGFTAPDEEKEAARRKRQEEMYSARRIFIAGTAAAATSDGEKAAIDALANHSQHLHLASSPAFEVLSEETKEKIRLMQKKQTWHDTKELKTTELLKTCSSTKDLTDALSCTSDYSTTSSAPPNPPLAVVCGGLDQPNSSSDYASSDPSPCTRNSTSPASRPSNLVLSSSTTTSTSSNTVTVPQQPMSRSQKIRLRTKLGARDPARRHTLSDVDTLKEGRLDKLARWFGIRKSSPDVSRDGTVDDGVSATAHHLPKLVEVSSPPPVVIVRSSPNELTPVSGDEQL